MTALIRRLTSFFVKSPDAMPEDAIEHLVRSELERFRSADPQTTMQWQRLRTAIADRTVEPAGREILPRTSLAVVVGVLAIVVAGVVTYMSLSSPDVLLTQKGEHKEALLNDGSQVVLSHTTRLVSLAMRSGEARKVSLEGEAYFRVRPSAFPFVVSTGYGEVHVVGTEFNVRARDGSLTVGVVNGSVNVVVEREGTRSALRLEAGEMARVVSRDAPRKIGRIPAADYPDWLHGKLFLNQTPFAAACRELELRFNVPIFINTPGAHEPLTGILDAQTTHSALTSLCEVAGKKFTYDGKAYHIY